MSDETVQLLFMAVDQASSVIANIQDSVTNLRASVASLDFSSLQASGAAFQTMADGATQASTAVQANAAAQQQASDAASAGASAQQAAADAASSAADAYGAQTSALADNAAGSQAVAEAAQIVAQAQQSAGDATIAATDATTGYGDAAAQAASDAQSLADASQTISTAQTETASATAAGTEALHAHGEAAGEAENGLSGLGGIVGQLGGSTMPGMTGSLGSAAGALSEMSEAAGPAAAGVVALGAAVEVTSELFHSFIEDTEQVRTLGLESGMSANEVVGLQTAMQAAGVSADSMQRVVIMVSRNLQSMQDQLDAGKNPTGHFASALDQLGIDATNASGQMKSITELLPELMDAFQQANETGILPSGRAFNAAGEAAAIFGARVGPQLLPLLIQGRGALDDATAAAAKYGIASEDNVAKLEAWNAAQAQLSLTTRGITDNLGAGLAPAFIALANAELGAIQGTQQLGTAIDANTQKIQQDFSALGDVVAQVVGGIEDHWDQIGPVLQTGSDLAVTAIAVFRDSIELIVTDVTDVVQTVDALVHGDWSGAWHDAESIVTDTTGGVLHIVEDLASGIKNQLLDLSAPITAPFREGFDQAKAAVESGASGILDDIEHMKDGILNDVADFPTLLEHAGESLIDGLKNGIESKIHDVEQEGGKVGGLLNAAFKGLEGISSPSSVWAGYGVNLVEGLIQGVESSEGNAISVVTAFAQHLNSAFSASLTPTLGGNLINGAFGAVGNAAQPFADQWGGFNVSTTPAHTGGVGSSLADAIAAITSAPATQGDVSFLTGAQVGPSGFGSPVKAGGGGGGGGSSAAATAQQAVNQFLSQTAGTLSMNQLVSGLLWAGVPQSQVAEMAATIMAESGGNVDTTPGGSNWNPVPVGPRGEHAVGLGQFIQSTWQNTMPNVFQTGANAGEQLQAIAKLLAGSGIGQWEAGPTNVNSAAQFLPAAQAALAGGGVGTLSGGSSSSAQPVDYTSQLDTATQKLAADQQTVIDLQTKFQQIIIVGMPQAVVATQAVSTAVAETTTALTATPPAFQKLQGAVDALHPLVDMVHEVDPAIQQVAVSTESWAQSAGHVGVAMDWTNTVVPAIQATTQATGDLLDGYHAIENASHIVSRQQVDDEFAAANALGTTAQQANLTAQTDVAAAATAQAAYQQLLQAHVGGDASISASALKTAGDVAAAAQSTADTSVKAATASGTAWSTGFKQATTDANALDAAVKQVNSDLLAAPGATAAIDAAIQAASVPIGAGKSSYLLVTPGETEAARQAADATRQSLIPALQAELAARNALTDAEKNNPPGSQAIADAQKALTAAQADVSGINSLLSVETTTYNNYQTGLDKIQTDHLAFRAKAGKEAEQAQLDTLEHSYSQQQAIAANASAAAAAARAAALNSVDPNAVTALNSFAASEDAIASSAANAATQAVTMANAITGAGTAATTAAQHVTQAAAAIANAGGPNTTGGSSYTGYGAGKFFDITGFDSPLGMAMTSWVTATQQQTNALNQNTNALNQSAAKSRVAINGSTQVDSSVSYTYSVASPASLS